MPAQSPLDALVHAMEAASGTKATVADRGDHMRVSVSAPPDTDAFQAVLKVLRGAAWWGSTDATGELRLWGAVRKEGEPAEAQGQRQGEAATE